MACISVAVVVPTFSIPGLTLGFAIPNLGVGVDFCCKIAIGPFPNLPPVTLPIPIPALLFVAVNAALMALQLYIDQLLAYTAISCPLDS